MQLTYHNPDEISVSLCWNVIFVITNKRKSRDELLKDPTKSSLPYNPSYLINPNIIYINYWTLMQSPIKFEKKNTCKVQEILQDYRINLLFKGYFANNLMVICLPWEKKYRARMKWLCLLIVHLHVFMHWIVVWEKCSV